MRKRRPQNVRPLSPAFRAWLGSERFRSMAKANARRNLARFAMAPRCGALARSTGQPCQKPALKGCARCRVHGGATPRGDAWHRAVWPNGDSPDAERKLNRKLRGLERRAKKRALRLAGMSPEKREAYAAWQAAHRPGSAAARARGRTERAEAQATRRSLAAADQPQPLSAEAAELAAYRDSLLAQLEALEADRSPRDELDLSTSTEWCGVFA